MGRLEAHVGAVFVCPVCEHMRVSENLNVESDDDCYRGSHVICPKRRVTKRMQSIWAMHFARRTKENDDLATDTRIRMSTQNKDGEEIGGATLYLCDDCATRYHHARCDGLPGYDDDEEKGRPALPRLCISKEVSAYEVYAPGYAGGKGVPH